jgi:hypothetical protein
MNQTLLSAISGLRMIEFNYQGCHRIAEPHVYGSKDGKDEILVWQVGGTSNSGPLPNWRRPIVAEITGLKISSKTFAGARPPNSGDHSSWDTIYAHV